MLVYKIPYISLKSSCRYYSNLPEMLTKQLTNHSLEYFLLERFTRAFSPNRQVILANKKHFRLTAACTTSSNFDDLVQMWVDFKVLVEFL